jgi:dihydrodipicolinate synthase/N-acetylneuraminate lyase
MSCPSSHFLEGNPVPLKWAMSLLGHMNAELRLPLCEPAETTRTAVRKALKAAQDSAARAISYMRLI